MSSLDVTKQSLQKMPILSLQLQLFHVPPLRITLELNGQGLLLLLRIRSAHLRIVAELRVSQGRYLLMQMYFCAVYDYAVKADLSKGC